MTATIPVEATWQRALGVSLATLTRIAAYSLPQALDRRILDLGERKETLTEDERDELLAWMDFSQQRSAERLQAEIAIQRLADACPDLTVQA